MVWHRSRLSIGDASQVRPSSRFTDRAPAEVRPGIPHWAALLLIAGVYLTLRGYHAFDGDQAYRLPLYFHRQDPGLYAADPFVAAIERFNPHRGYLALLGIASRPLGLAVALAGLFGLTMAATMAGVGRLARSAWPQGGASSGLVAVILVLMAKAGNIGTNHLFEATLLDRLVGFALGWLAIAAAIGDPSRGARPAAVLLALASLVHPSVGLQLTLTLIAGWVAWAVLPGEARVDRSGLVRAVGWLALGQCPALALMMGQGGRLFEGLPADQFRQLAVLVQGPQHMLPSTWRMPQRLAWGCYPVLALLAFGRVGLAKERDPWPAPRARLAALLGVNLVSLGVAYLAIEGLGNLKVTIFQPFRMATLARGLALVAVSGRLVGLWRRGDLASRGRAVLVGVGLSGDRALVVATGIDGAIAVAEWAGASARVRAVVGLASLALGLGFLARHDTESGHVGLILALGALGVGTAIGRRWSIDLDRRRLAFVFGLAWAVPAWALMVPLFVARPESHPWAVALLGRCRFAEVPTDDLERLGVWAREHTPASSRFIGPPGPKGFRLWSRRDLAFNRSGSPYDAQGLADWSTRYRDHVGFSGTTAGFVRAYLDDRHALEARYQAKTDREKAELAARQGAGYVLAAAPGGEERADPSSPLELLKVEGRYAIFRVRSEAVFTSRARPLPGE